jgi:hypothetical protein
MRDDTMYTLVASSTQGHAALDDPLGQRLALLFRLAFLPGF